VAQLSRPVGNLVGGCQCGAVRFEIAARRVPVYACHCRDCQKQTASAFGLSVPVRASAFTVSGPLERWSRTADSGATTQCFFCRSCGARVYHASTGSPDQVTVKGGTLDETEDLSPVAHLWVSRKQPWVSLADGARLFDTQPDNLGAWRAALIDQITD
jgi:hypothetical protein